MSQAKSSSKLPVFILVVVVGAAAGFGYYKQSASLSETAAKAETATAQEQTATAQKVLTMRPNDIILGDPNALITVVEYSSLSCSHCASFHQEVLPKLQKEFIENGKVKLVVRHFPLNEPALKAAMIVECAGKQGLSRANFMKALFENQNKWAFDVEFMKNLRQIASVGGMDSAAFESCISDQDLENRLVAGRQEAQELLDVNATPAFFINGKSMIENRSIDGFREAFAMLHAAPKAAEDAAKADTKSGNEATPAAQ